MNLDDEDASGLEGGIRFGIRALAIFQSLGGMLIVTSFECASWRVSILISHPVNGRLLQAQAAIMVARAKLTPVTRGTTLNTNRSNRL